MTSARARMYVDIWRLVYVNEGYLTFSVRVAFSFYLTHIDKDACRLRNPKSKNGLSDYIQIDRLVIYLPRRKFFLLLPSHMSMKDDDDDERFSFSILRL